MDSVGSSQYCSAANISPMFPSFCCRLNKNYICIRFYSFFKEVCLNFAKIVIVKETKLQSFGQNFVDMIVDCACNMVANHLSYKCVRGKAALQTTRQISPCHHYQQAAWCCQNDLFEFRKTNLLRRSFAKTVCSNDMRKTSVTKRRMFRQGLASCCVRRCRKRKRFDETLAKIRQKFWR